MRFYLTWTTRHITKPMTQVSEREFNLWVAASNGTKVEEVTASDGVVCRIAYPMMEE